jgi:hypothetical protein
MAGMSRKTGKRTYEVLISFNALDKGERFTQDADDLGWATQHTTTGYLRDVTVEPTVEVSQDAGEVGKG